MNREIKFRAWDKENNEFIPSYFTIGNNGEIDSIDCGKDMQQPCDSDQFILSQFTGQLSIDGKEIYTKDLLSERWKVEVYQCENTGAFMVKFHTNPKGNKPKTLFDYLNSRKKAGTDDVDCVVIGNIYTHKHLLNA